MAPLHLFNLGRGLLKFVFRGEADQPSWQTFLWLHCRTNGCSTAALTWLMRKLCPPKQDIKAFDSMLGHFEPNSVEAIAAKIREDGYYVFESRIPEALCDVFANACMNIEARVSRDPENRSPKAKFDPNAPIGHVYDLPEADVWQVPSGQALIADPIFLNLAQAYFKTIPAMKDLNVWWSAVLDGKPDSHSAQLFHFDYDAAPIWLKFFVYITDVTETTGPHTFVRSSHRTQQPKAREILSRGYVRIPDHEIAEVYGKENIIELTGKKGTVLAVDTLGFHKGKAPQSGYRLVAQLEFATPLFAKSATHPMDLPEKMEPALADTLETYPWAFQRYKRRA